MTGHSDKRRFERESACACAILDLLPRHVRYRIALSVSTLPCGDLQVLASAGAFSMLMPQGALADGAFPAVAARHIAGRLARREMAAA